MSIRYLSGLTVDSTVLVVDAANDRVGIGTASPAYKLDVSSDIRIGEGLRMSPNAGALYAIDGALSYYSSTNGVYLNGAGTNGWLRLNGSGVENDSNSINIYGAGAGGYIELRTGTSTRILIQNGGNVGIGTTTPVGILHLYKAAAATRLAIDGDAGQNRLISYRTGALQRFGLYVNNTAESGSNAGSNFAIRAYSDAGTLLSTPFFINRATGNVGIGTTAPVSIGTGITTLDIQGSNAGGVAFGPSGTKNYIYGASTMYVEAHTTAVFTTSGSERMRITSAGNVGIGTTSPTSLLSVQGNTDLGNSYGNTTSSLSTTRISGFALYQDASNRYGNYGVLILNSDTGWTASARRFMITNGLGTNKFAIIRSVDASTDPALGTAGSVASGTVDFEINNAGAATFSSSVTASSLIKSGGTSAQYLMADGSVSTLTNPVTGTGTTNYIPKFTGASTIGDSLLVDNGTNVYLGNVDGGGKALVINGTGATTATIYFDSTTKTYGLYQTGTQSNLLTGNLGLGVTPSAWNSIYKVAEIGTAAIFGTSSYNSAAFSTNVFYNASNSPRYIANDFANMYWQDDGNHIWYSAPSGTAGDAITFTQAMTLTAGGNLGIGTTGPLGTLDIGKSSATPSLVIGNSSYGSLYNSVWGLQGGAQSIMIFGNNGQNEIRAGSTGAGGYLDFYTNNTAVFTAASNGNFAMRLAANGNVGIGTTAPSTKLEVGDFLDAVTNKITVSARYEYEPEFNFRLGQTGTGFDWIGAVISSGDDGNYNGKILFKTANAGRDTPTTKMVIKASGNVGIGTTSPGIGDGTYVAPLTISSASSLGTFLAIKNTQATYGMGGVWMQANTGNAGWLFGTDNDGKGVLHYGSGASENDALTDAKDGTKGITIDTSGNVGIGTTSPGARLDVNGAANIKGTANFAPVLTLGTAGAINAVINSADEMFFNIDSDNNQTGAAFWFGHNSNQGDTASNLMIIKDSGNVGIGTTAPGQKLQVDGNIYVNDDGTTGNGIMLRGADRPLIARGWDLFTSGNKTGVGRWGVYMESSELFIGAPGTDYSNALITLGGWLVNGTREPNLTLNNSTQRVGIGTTSPQDKLEIKSGYLRMYDPSSSTGAGYFLQWSSDNGGSNVTYAGIDAITTSAGVRTGDLRFSTSSAGAPTEKMRITSAGNVGIGTTAPSKKLQVYGSDNVFEGILVENSNSNAYALYQSKTANSNIWQWGTWNDNSYRTGISGVGDFITITSGGNVGIGTTSPGEKLDVYQSTNGFGGINARNPSAGAAAHSGLAIGNDIGVNSGGIIVFGSAATYSFPYNPNGTYIYSNRAGGVAINSEAAAPLYLATNNTARLYITSAGNVGIGTTSPSKTLHVYTTGNEGIFLQGTGGGVWMDVQCTGSELWSYGCDTGGAGIYNRTDNAYRFYVNNDGNVGIGTTAPVTPLQVVSATNDVDVLRIGNTAGNSGSVQSFTHLAINHFNAGTFPSTRITAYQDGVSGWPGGMYFSTREVNTDSAPLERLRITSAGSIGINTTNPTSRLEVVGDARITTGSLGVGVAPNATDGRIDASNDIVAFSTSDRRLKENITPIANALEKVRSLTGVEFDWKQETKSVHGYEGHDVGVIAQDVQAVLPEAVRTNDSGYLSVRYEKMIALLVEANKELADRVEQLEKLIK